MRSELAPSASALVGRRLYLCTPDRPDLAAFVADCIRGGVDVIQLRDKSLDARCLISRARVARQVCNDAGVPFILNDRPDLALESEADGVHLGQDDAPVALARRMLGPTAIIGLSTHAPSEVATARQEQVDYLSAGPVVPTPTKPGRPGTGIDYIRFAVQGNELPVFVTGGVTPESIHELALAGARHFVVVRYLTESQDPRTAASQLISAIDRALDQPVERLAGH